MSSSREIAIHALKRYLTKNYSSHIDMSNVGSKATDREYNLMSRCIAALSIKYHNTELDNEICADSVCDGSDDHGVDAIYVNHDKRTVTVVQSKFDSSGNGSIGRSEINDFLNSCKEILLEKYDLFNARFRRSESDLDNAYDASYKYIFAFSYSGGNQLSHDVQTIIEQNRKELNYDIGPDATTISILNLDDLRDFISNPNSIKIDMDDVEVLQYGLSDHPLPAVHGIVTGDIVAHWWENYGDRLFEKNIRGGLGDVSEVNQAIRDTLINRPELFYYFNNGITILVDSYAPRRRNNINRRESGGFDFKNMSVINGAQTISTIGKAYQSGDATDDILSKVKISCRFIKSLINNSDDATDDDVDDISLDITIANNNQNKVTSRDFASKDPIQLELRKSISFEHPYQYEIKRSDTPQANPSPYIIDMDDALNALVCCNFSLRNIANLKSNRGRFFESLTGPLYKSVFNPSITSVKVINAVNVYRECLNHLLHLEKTCTVKREQKIVIHGRYVLISIAMNKHPNILNSSSVIAMTSLPNFTPTLDDAFDTITTYIDNHYSSSHMPRFFENQQKLKEIYALFSM
ncbi:MULTISPECIES: AIPR family protein [Citrobacter freundii complex]|uniref:AIPR family protein n=1 Tax=Citrobacter freundii complex TaxID=1344959 RepID=UPI0015FF3EB6|nr:MULTISPECIES: AIPR family protein [Citrobacter freundii complex]EKU6849921.1 AIPR family protein [Citrobacter freundii]EKU6862134.1 AIPR family protein [Citrobacter freundii]MCX2449090.1 AIPR family protein [Citrobacter freundii complex sp. 2022EL-00822]MCX2490316.1 AIPR family protein [Citrobacter freundii complex sp. 2022EL-00971]MDF0510515.1 AIPR family protein [Citrobacter freundii]